MDLGSILTRALKRSISSLVSPRNSVIQHANIVGGYMAGGDLAIGSRRSATDATVNGKKICIKGGGNISIIDGVIKVDGKIVQELDSGYHITVEGDVRTLACDASVDVKGNVETLEADGSVRIGGNCGSLEADGSVHIDGSLNGDAKVEGSFHVGINLGTISRS